MVSLPTHHTWGGGTESLGSRSGPPRSSLVPGLGGVLLTCGQHMLICKPRMQACRATTGLGEGWPSHLALLGWPDLSPACPHMEGGGHLPAHLGHLGGVASIPGSGCLSLGVGGRLTWPRPGVPLCQVPS